MPDHRTASRTPARAHDFAQSTLRDILDPQRLAAPEHIALIEVDREMSYHALAQRVAGVAHALKDQGIVPGDRVAILLPNNTAFLECFFGIVSIGAIVVPLNTRLHPREHVQLLRDCGPALMVAHGDHADTVDAVRAAFPAMPVVMQDAHQPMPDVADYAAWRPLRDALPPLEIEADQPASLLYTSGTTSSPKGVVLSHRNYMADFDNVRAVAGLDAGSINLQLSPLYHAAGVHTQVHLAVGGTTILQPRFDPLQVMAAVQHYGVHYFFCVPTMLYQILDHPQREQFRLDSLRTISYGAAAITGARLEQALDVFGCKLLHAYGMTETTSHASILRPEEHLQAAGSIGRGLPGTALRVVDAQGNDVAADVAADGAAPDAIGEIIVRGANVMQAYWQRPDETRVVLRDGWLHTGDLARRDARGFVYIVDRKKDMIISGGVNIYPRETEEVLARHPAVAEVAAYGIPDELWGEALAAAVVLRPGREVTADALLAFAAQQLARMKLPKVLFFVDTLPRTASGKVQKARLRAAGIPGSSS